MLISRGWVQAAALTLLFGFFVLLVSAVVAVLAVNA